MRIFTIFLITHCLLACSKKVAKTNELNRPNVIIIMTDDQGWGDLSLHGNTNLSTPNIDSLAIAGTQFNNFYVQPVCSPSRAELLTGRYFKRLGVYSTSAGGERINPGETTIAEIFNSAGYKTALFGKWHNGTQPPYHPIARGFDEFYGFTSGHWGNYFNPLLEHNFELINGEGYIIDDLTQKAIEYIEDQNGDPFFIMLSYNTPHSPMQVPDVYWERMNEKKLSMFYSDRKLEDMAFTNAALAMVENIDHNVGRIKRKLKALHQDPNTIIVFLSDNGPNSWRWNGGMKGRKGSTDEGGVRSPFFIYWPGRLNPQIVEEIAGSIDILPTLASLAGINAETNQPLDGVDLSPLFSGNHLEWRPRLIYNSWNSKTSVRSQRFRLDSEDQLFDISVDPGQTKDLSSVYPEKKDSLIAARSDWLQMFNHDQAEDDRPFPVGHQGFPTSMLPARDGVPYGDIRRSNQYPNCSFFTNWKRPSDKMAWNIEVLEEGRYQVELYYTCNLNAIGKQLELSWGDKKLSANIEKSHNPELRGMENDRTPRIESYVKDFIKMDLGTFQLSKGTGELILSSNNIAGNEELSIRMLIVRKKS